MSQLVNNLKTASSRRLRNLNKEHVQSFYKDACLETGYIEAQGVA